MRHSPVKQRGAEQRRKSGKEESNKQVNDCRISALKWEGVKKKDKGERGERTTPAAPNDGFRRPKNRGRR